MTIYLLYDRRSNNVVGEAETVEEAERLRAEWNDPDLEVLPSDAHAVSDGHQGNEPSPKGVPNDVSSAPPTHAAGTTRIPAAPPFPTSNAGSSAPLIETLRELLRAYDAVEISGYELVDKLRGLAAAAGAPEGQGSGSLRSSTHDASAGEAG